MELRWSEDRIPQAAELETDVANVASGEVGTPRLSIDDSVYSMRCRGRGSRSRSNKERECRKIEE